MFTLNWMALVPPKKATWYCTPHWRIQGGPGPPPLFLDQTETRRAEKNFFGDRPPLSKGLDDPPPPPISRSGSGPATYLICNSPL